MVGVKSCCKNQPKHTVSVLMTKPIVVKCLWRKKKPRLSSLTYATSLLCCLLWCIVDEKRGGAGWVGLGRLKGRQSGHWGLLRSLLCRSTTPFWEEKVHKLLIFLGSCSMTLDLPLCVSLRFQCFGSFSSPMSRVKDRGRRTFYSLLRSIYLINRDNRRWAIKIFIIGELGSIGQILWRKNICEYLF